MRKIILGLFLIAAVAVSYWQWDRVRAKNLREQLDNQILLYWEAVIAHDLPTMYQLEAGRLTDGLQPDQFYDRQRAKAVEIVGYSVQSLAVDKDRAKVTLEILKTFPALFGKSYTSVVTDGWILLDGQWLHDTPKPPKLPEAKSQPDAAPNPMTAPPEVSPGNQPEPKAAEPI